MSSGLGDLDGTVSSLAAGVDATTQSGTASIQVPDGRLRVGAFAHAYIDAGEVCALTVPLSALLTGPDGTAVEIVRNNRVETRRVSVGLLEQSDAEVRDGLREGDQVVARAGAFLRDGDPVRPVPLAGAVCAGRLMGWGRTALLIAALMAAPAMRSAAAEAPCHVARLALVIGNAAYADSDAPLREPIANAREFADAVQRLGFATTEAENLSQDRMRSVIEAFEQKVTGDAVALVFFSGFGIQTGSHTYLIPVDAAIWNEQDIKTVGFNLDRILSDLSEHGAKLRFVIVDGARRNPYERRFRPTGAQGMAAVSGTPGGAGPLFEPSRHDLRRERRQHEPVRRRSH